MAGERRALVGVGRGRHAEADPGVEARAAARRLQHVGGIALFAHGLVGGGRDEHDVAVGRVVQRATDRDARRTAAVVAEAHVDRLHAVIGRVDDRGCDRGVAEVGLLDHQAAVVARARDPRAVAGRRARERRDVRAVALLVGPGRPAGARRPLIGEPGDLRRQLWMRRVDPGVDHADERVLAARHVPGGREALAQQRPGERRLARQRRQRRAGGRLWQRQRRVVGQLAQPHPPLRLDGGDAGPRGEPTGGVSDRLAATRADGDEADLRHVGGGAAVAAGDRGPCGGAGGVRVGQHEQPAGGRALRMCRRCAGAGEQDQDSGGRARSPAQTSRPRTSCPETTAARRPSSG